MTQSVVGPSVSAHPPTSEPMSEPDADVSAHESTGVPAGPLVMNSAQGSSASDAEIVADILGTKRHCTVDVRLPSDPMSGLLVGASSAS